MFSHRDRTASDLSAVSQTPMKNVFNACLYVLASQPRGISSASAVDKNFISAGDERKLGNEKASRRNFTSPPETRLFMFFALSRAIFGSQSLRHAQRTLSLLSSHVAA